MQVPKENVTSFLVVEKDYNVIFIFLRDNLNLIYANIILSRNFFNIFM